MGLKLKQDYVNWLRAYDWAWLCTLTFRDGIRRKAATRIFGEWVAQLQASEPEKLSWVRMGEYSPGKVRYHFHALIAGVQHVTPREAIGRWERLAGRAEIGIYDSGRRGLEYALKSIEDTADFDIDLHLEEKHLRSDAGRKTTSISPIGLDATRNQRSDDSLAQVPPQCREHGAPRVCAVEQNDSAVVCDHDHAGETRLTTLHSYAAQASGTKARRVMTIRELWSAMCQKCSGPTPPFQRNHRNARYAMCRRWRGYNGFKLFVQDMGERPSQRHRLCRINKVAAFSPSNCIWSLRKIPRS